MSKEFSQNPGQNPIFKLPHLPYVARNPSWNEGLELGIEGLELQGEYRPLSGEADPAISSSNHTATKNEPDFVIAGEEPASEEEKSRLEEKQWWQDHNGVVTEETWPAWQANGFVVVEDLPVSVEDEFENKVNVVIARYNFGSDNVFIGQAYDAAAGRPLQHKPGRNVYTTHTALERYEQEKAKVFQKAVDIFRTRYPDHMGVITEENWPKYQDQGFLAVTNGPIAGDIQDNGYLYTAMLVAGSRNVYIGQSFDEDAERPLRLKPGSSIYISPEGLEQAQDYMRVRGLPKEQAQQRSTSTNH